MEKVKLAVIYYSSTGGNYQMAQWATEAGKNAGAEVKLVKIAETAPEEALNSNPAWKRNYENTKHIPEVTLDDLEWADAIIWSVPTRYGGTPAQVQAFIDTTGGLWFEGKLNNKVVTVMSSAMNPNGGQESTILGLYKNMCHWGAVLVPTGYSDPVLFKSGGNPYGISATIDGEGNIQTDSIKEGIEHQIEKVVQMSTWIKTGIEELQEN
jgi:NAD(P)H dehydrogenase (quinone)